jgi:predicted enzyme related to lactoylglutathione lyase
MGQPVVHFEVLGSDGEKLQKFYADLFGWKVDADNPMKYGMVNRDDNLNPDGIGIGGGIAGMPDSGPGHVTIYVEVPDVEASLAKAEKLGATRLMGPEQVPGGPEIGLFSDFEGHIMGVVKAGSM